ncbi:OmpA family protein [Flammeovirga sp. SubArs3]|uniref:OmpA family protein n=1 Tax=Flammeovirga sp. SubArs3 TaxID=2995316 RepID=UPI00248CF30C|nr:OmpA family protein [Flammeovirga sp. SubArs3]
MKKYIYIVFLLISSMTLGQTMQNQKVQNIDERNEERFENMDYASALKHYKKQYEKETDLEKKQTYAIHVAECLQKLNKPQESVQVFQELDSAGIEILGETAEIYADALSNTGEYKEAKKWYKVAFNEPNGQNSARIYGKMKNLSMIDTLQLDKDLFLVNNAPFNSENDDFSPLVYNGGVVFASNRPKGTGAKKYAWDGGSFLDLFYYDSTGNIKNFSKKINSKFHEASAAISPDGNMIVFTRSDKKEKTEDKQSNLQLMVSSKNQDGTWGKPSGFLWNSVDFSTGHPAFSTDGKRLYFVSDRPEGVGGADIYYSEVSDGGKFGSPVLMGKEINTVENEVFPVIINDKLYFSSNGWGGLGGLDIVMQDLKNIQSRPVHLKAPINSSYDDFGGAQIDMNTYYISSNRATTSSSNENDNILEIKKSFFKGIVIDKFTREPIEMADVTVLGKRVAISDSAGLFKVSFEDWNQQDIIGGKDGYQPDSVLIEEAVSKISTGELIVLELSRPIIEGIVYDSLSKEPLIARVTIAERSTGKKVEVFTDSTGYYRIPVMANEHYDFLSERPRYFTRRQAANTGVQVITERNIAMNPIVGQRVRIYYDFDKFDIRSDASHSLDTVVTVMKYNPTITIELSSHTDIRGRESYNQKLSDERAKEAFDYAVSKGISADRMTYKGYGETMPVIECKNKRCSEEEHQMNRRTEFYVTGYINEKGYFGADYNKFYPDSLSEVLVDSDGELMRSTQNTITGIFESMIGGVEGYDVFAYDDQNKPLAKDKTTKEGVFNLIVPNQYKYKVVIEKEGLEVTHRYINLEEFDGKSSFDVVIYK